LSTAKAAAANKAAISSAAPTASTARLVLLFVFTYRSFPRLMGCFVVFRARSVDRRS
jgi:hypothetical protein